MNERVLSTPFMSITARLGWYTDTSFLFVALHLPDYWWIHHIFMAWPCISFCTLSICTPRPFFYCETRFFLIGLYMLAYILNSYLSSSKYIEIFQSVLVFHSCFWCLITSLSWSFIAFEFVWCLGATRMKKKHFSLYSSSIYVVFHLWLFNLCGIYFCAWWGAISLT